MNGINERAAISRAHTSGKIYSLTDSVSTTAIIEKQSYAGIGVITAEQLASVEFYVSYDKVTFEKLKLFEEFTLTDEQAFVSPPEVWPFPFVKMVVDTDTEATIGLIG